MKVNMLEAKSQLSRLVRQALDGEDVIISNNGEPMVKLVPVATKGLVGRGRLKKFTTGIDGAFTPSVDAQVARLFRGRP